MAEIIDGNKIAENIKTQIKKELEELKLKTNKTPSLHAIIVGENPAIEVYIKNQQKACQEVGISYHQHKFEENITKEELVGFIEKLNSDEDVTGIILQLPLPKGLNPREIQPHISPKKDVEGITPQNLGMLVYSETKTSIAPCTALAVMECIKSTGVELKGKEVVIVGHSEIVGKPIALMMLSSLFESATPTVCHIATKDLKFHTSRADILIVAVGKAEFIKPDMVKEGAIVIDVGINRVPLTDASGNVIVDEKTGKPKMRTVGDVEFEGVKEKALYITPVPGGVGAVTTVMLLKNTFELFKSSLYNL